MIPPVSVATRDRAVLVVIDIQDRLAAAMERREQVVARTRLLVRVADIVGLPVVVTRQYPRGLGELDERVSEALSQLSSIRPVHVDKLAFDCFAEPLFCEAIAATGRDQLLLAGMETHICIAQTALAGLREGFDVHVAADACCSRAAECHDVTLTRLGSAGAVATLSESIAYELVGSAGTDEFKQLLGAVKA